MVSIGTQYKWDRYIQFLQKHSNLWTQWEREFIRSVVTVRAAGLDLSTQRAIWLCRTFHRIESLVG